MLQGGRDKVDKTMQKGEGEDEWRHVATYSNHLESLCYGFKKRKLIDVDAGDAARGQREEAC